ncbi:hypothetical protein N9L18_01195 [Candidatus Pacebacteria bacterium]|nr:hypothetical protein [Candidatus Paceibacterota bacterium]
MSKNKEVEIIPAIMPTSYKDLVSHTDRVSGLVTWVQVDVMDGKYTNSISWPYTKGSKHFEEIINGEEGLPNWEDFDFSIDLMVRDSYAEVPKWIAAGASRIILHWGSLKGGDIKGLIETIKEVGVEVSLAKVPHEDIFEIEEFVSLVDSIQFMGIDQIGFQGEPFVESVIDDIADFHKKHPEVLISIDGGVNSETAKKFIKAGARRLVSGSFIFANQNGVKESIAELTEVSRV